MELIMICCVILLSVFIVCIIFAMKLSQHIFRCKHCSKEFKIKWTKLIFVTHCDDEYTVKCPYCKEKGCIVQSDDK